jgi:hypothetical protein
MGSRDRATKEIVVGRPLDRACREIDRMQNSQFPAKSMEWNSIILLPTIDANMDACADRTYSRYNSFPIPLISAQNVQLRALLSRRARA